MKAQKHIFLKTVAGTIVGHAIYDNRKAIKAAAVKAYQAVKTAAYLKQMTSMTINPPSNVNGTDTVDAKVEASAKDICDLLSSAMGFAGK